MKYRERYLKRLQRFRGKAVGFFVDSVRLPNGRTAIREYLDHPGAVAVVPVLSPGKIVMVRQYRHPVKQVTLEIPAGKLDQKERVLTCVRRELAEETGYRAGRIWKLISFWPTPAFANEVIHIYVADRLKPGKANPDGDEFLRCETWPLKKLYAEIARGHIRDSKTLIALLAYRCRSGSSRP